MEYAIVEIAGKQYKAQVGKTLLVDSMQTADQEVTIPNVLAYHSDSQTLVGTPFVAEASVTAKVVGATKAKKVRVLRFKAKSHYHKVTGHRQPHTKLVISAITVGGKKATAEESKPARKTAKKEAAD